MMRMWETGFKPECFWVTRSERDNDMELETSFPLRCIPKWIYVKSKRLQANPDLCYRQKHSDQNSSSCCCDWYGMSKTWPVICWRNYSNNTINQHQSECVSKNIHKSHHYRNDLLATQSCAEISGTMLSYSICGYICLVQNQILECVFDTICITAS